MLESNHHSTRPRLPVVLRNIQILNAFKSSIRRRRGKVRPNAWPERASLTSPSPLKPDELQVLRAQYEKEGEYVGVQTKFNYAWVCSSPRDNHAVLTGPGPYQVQPTRRTTIGRPAPLRYLQDDARAKERMLILSGARQL